MRHPLMLDVMIACPDDVREERNAAEETCAIWNDTRSSDVGVYLRALSWHRHVGIASGQSAQASLNTQLLSDADILIGIFWTRFGTPTDKYDSGTQEEIERFLEMSKPVILYFVDKQANPSQIDATHLAKINEFKKKYEPNAYRMIADISDLKNKLLIDLDHSVKFFRKNLSGGFELSSKGRKLEPSQATESVWYEQSINALIREYLNDSNLSHVPYRKGITWQENLHLNRDVHDIPYESLKRSLERAREHAFSVKYGNYDYSKDLRTRYPSWYRPIHDILQPTHVGDVLGVGANSGEELSQVFGGGHLQPQTVSILDLSHTAIERGRKRFPNFIFHLGNMEESALQRDSFDVYLNLRSIHSSGVEIKATIAEALRVLRSGGICVISISDGYLAPVKPGDNELVPVKGMFDTRTELFSRDKPYRLAEKVREKLDDYGFLETGLRTGPTEIFVWGTKWDETQRR